MGHLLSIWRHKDEKEIFIDFENAKPTARSEKVYNDVDDVLKRGALVMKSIEDYKGCRDVVRKAMSQPSPENDKAAFDALLVVVNDIASFFEYAKKLEDMLPGLLIFLSKPPADEKKQSVEDQQDTAALAKQLADVLDFTLRFDQRRMLRPTLSNDFSYYRRLLPKFIENPKIRVKDEDAGAVGMFTAEHIPMLNALARASQKALAQNVHVTETLALMANSCLKMIRSKSFDKPDINLFCARAMTGAIVLFDHVDGFGAFSKKSPIHIKLCISTLKKDFPQEQGLLSAIQFSSKTFKNAPQAIQDLFED